MFKYSRTHKKMTSRHTGLSKYMKVLLAARFPQAHLMTAKDFLSYLREMDVDLTIEELEFYDKHSILRPAIRFRQPVDEHGFITGYFSGPRIRAMKEERNMIELPSPGDFQPWKTYEKERDQRWILYYHPFQFILAHWLTTNHEIRLGPIFLEEIRTISKKRLRVWKTRSSKVIHISRKSAANVWIPVVGLLMLLEEAYGVFATGRLTLDPWDRDYSKKWRKWRGRKQLPMRILKQSGMTIDKVKEAYDHVADLGHMQDPLSHWYPLLELIKPSKKQKLTGAARRAQEYYSLARMAQQFIKDLTGEDLLDPDDKWDSNHQNWKPMKYGTPFDYSSRKTKRLIRDDYFVDRPTLISIIFEGDTEQVVIEKLLKLFMPNPEEEGYQLYNAKGSGNLTKSNLDGLIKTAKSQQMEVYLIIDNDSGAKKTLEEQKKAGNIQEGMYTIWQKDFEHDNFGVDSVLKKVNRRLQERGLKKVSKREVTKRLHNAVLMKAIADVVRKQDKVRFDDVISKAELVEDLFGRRFKEIPKEYSRNQRWTPKLPIEKVIYDIFQMFPYTL